MYSKMRTLVPNKMSLKCILFGAEADYGTGSTGSH